MSLLGWNCQGAGSPLTGRNLKFLVNKYRPPLVFLSEIRANVVKIEKIRRRLGFAYAEYVPPVNTGGGLALWWMEGLELEVLATAKNHASSDW